PDTFEAGLFSFAAPAVSVVQLPGLGPRACGSDLINSLNQADKSIEIRLVGRLDRYFWHQYRGSKRFTARSGIAGGREAIAATITRDRYRWAVPATARSRARQHALSKAEARHATGLAANLRAFSAQRTSSAFRASSAGHSVPDIPPSRLMLVPVT